MNNPDEMPPGWEEDGQRTVEDGYCETCCEPDHDTCPCELDSCPCCNDTRRGLLDG